MLDQLAAHDYRCVLGTAYLEDIFRSPGYLAWHLRSNVHPGSIVILHDGPRRGKQTIAVLERVLPRCGGRGSSSCRFRIWSRVPGVVRRGKRLGDHSVSSVVGRRAI